MAVQAARNHGRRRRSSWRPKIVPLPKMPSKSPKKPS